MTGSTGTVVDALVGAITAANGGAVHLGQTATVESIANGAHVDTDAISTVVQVVTAAVDSVQSATDVTALAKAAEVAQGAATNALATTDFTVQAQVDALTQTYVTDLGTQVTNAQVGDVNGALIGTLGDDVLTGGNGVDAIDGWEGNDQINGLGADDLLYGGVGNDVLDGGAGNDFLDGGIGRDWAVYTDATGGITVNLAAGTVSGAGVGTDTLRSIEQIRGSNFADQISAAGFGTTGPNAPSPDKISFANNFIEGMAGDDTITGNGRTSISYESATAGVTVDLAAGTASGDASVGTDHFTGVISVKGSHSTTTCTAAIRRSQVSSFLPQGGNDYIDGRGGFDSVLYAFIIGGEAITGGISVDLAAGIVTGDASVGIDTLRSIESVRGTNFADHFDATGFSSSSTNAGSNGTANNFEGAGGDDVIVGNGNTQISYQIATAGVTVDLAAHTATGDASVGSDTFSGVIGVIGSYLMMTFCEATVTTTLLQGLPVTIF